MDKRALFHPYWTMLPAEFRGKFFSAALDFLAQTGISVAAKKVIEIIKPQQPTRMNPARTNAIAELIRKRKREAQL